MDKQGATMIKTDREIELDALGVDLARRLEWDGYDIFFTMERALIDANFHTAAAALRAAWDKYDAEQIAHIQKLADMLGKREAAK
jgi:hypothetical protein